MKNPLSGVTGNEDIEMITSKIGQERLIGMIQGYYLAKKHFINEFNN